VQSDQFALLITIAIILLVSFPVHEFSHAFAAYRLGDGTAKMFGRLTLNPITHFDPVGGGMLILSGLIALTTHVPIVFGMAKPTPVSPANLRYRRYGELIVAAAGPLSNLVLAALAALPLRYILHSTLAVDTPPIVVYVLADFVSINLVLMVFNFIPIPPLDGSKVLYALLDPGTVWRLRPTLEQYGFFILIVLIIPLGPGGSVLGRILGAVVNPLFSLLVGV
jgi:Zn-dependent protease